MHSFFKLPFYPLLPDDPNLSLQRGRIHEFFKYTKPHRKLLEQIELVIIDEISMVREFEETMHRTSSGIDSSDACRGEYNVFLFGIFADVTQECRFPCTRFPGQENRLTRILNQVQGVLKRCVIGVYAHNQIIPKCFIALLMPSSSMGAVT